MEQVSPLQNLIHYLEQEAGDIMRIQEKVDDIVTQLVISGDQCFHLTVEQRHDLFGKLRYLRGVIANKRKTMDALKQQIGMERR